MAGPLFLLCGSYGQQETGGTGGSPEIDEIMSIDPTTTPNPRPVDNGVGVGE